MYQGCFSPQQRVPSCCAGSDVAGQVAAALAAAPAVLNLSSTAASDSFTRAANLLRFASAYNTT
jgi:hypothetical protein